ncbi:MAG TPA: hypothetical protein VJN93_11420 [Candidatus Acidoferrum sp.]|nr:hypothetical protein [Candidatus Acidoferrum sp.]
MKIKTVLLLAAALCFCGEGAALVAHATPTKSATTKTTTATAKAKATVYHRTGTIESITDTDLVLGRKWKGKEENTTFVLNTDTKKEGSLDKGEMATVYYHMDKKERVATEVKISQAKTKIATKKS